MLRQVALGMIALGVLVAVALVAFLVAPQPSTGIAQASNAAQQTTTDTNTGIIVTGQGQVSVKPNTAIATIGVETVAANLNDATSQNNTKMTAVIDKLKSMGIADKDIQTVNYNVYPMTQPSPKGPDNAPPVITGYRVVNQVRVTIRKLEDAGKILDAAVTAGANNIYGVSFGVDDMTPYQQQARAAAIKDAQDKAGQLAKNAGVQLGSILAISEGTISAPVPMAAMGLRADSSGSVPVQTGEMQVSIIVNVRYAIK